MLNRKIFEAGIEEIETAFTGFIMTKQKADIWYKYSNHLIDSQWKKKIESCIKFCRKIPTLADILDLSGYYKKDEGWVGIPIFKEEEYKHKPIPPKIKEQIHKVLNMPDIKE